MYTEPLMPGMVLDKLPPSQRGGGSGRRSKYLDILEANPGKWVVLERNHVSKNNPTSFGVSNQTAWVKRAKVKIAVRKIGDYTHLLGYLPA